MRRGDAGGSGSTTGMLRGAPHARQGRLHAAFESSGRCPCAQLHQPESTMMVTGAAKASVATTVANSGARRAPHAAPTAPMATSRRHARSAGARLPLRLLWRAQHKLSSAGEASGGATRRMQSVAFARTKQSASPACSHRIGLFGFRSTCSKPVAARNASPLWKISPPCLCTLADLCSPHQTTRDGRHQQRRRDAAGAAAVGRGHTAGRWAGGARRWRHL